jgi:hypothetical protein
MAGFTNAASYIAPALQGVSLAANTARIAGNVLGVGSSSDELARSSCARSRIRRCNNCNLCRMNNYANRRKMRQPSAQNCR